MSSQTQTLERRVSLTATLVRHNDQFEYSNVREFDSVVLDLAYGLGGTKIPLLAHDFPERMAGIRRPSQKKLLCAPGFGLVENQPDTSEIFRLVKDEPNRLSS